MFQSVYSENELIGFEWRTPHFIAFYGTALGTLEKIKKAYPDLRWAQLKQVHKDVSCERMISDCEARPEADAHWTKETGLALVIATADCLPILAWEPQYVLAIHAGWRGIENEITIKSIRSSMALIALPKMVWFGPHIQQTSFEVDLELAENLQTVFQRSALPNQKNNCIFEVSKTNSNKAYVCLKTILRAQLSNLGVDDAIELNENTFTNPMFASYRREKGQPKRNLSFIVRLD